MKTRTTPLRAALLASRVVLLWSGMAHASSNYPETIQAVTGAAAKPECTLCHTTDSGGAGTVTRPFGKLMMNKYKLTSGNPDYLKRVLSGLQAEGVDSNGNGVIDFDELAQGKDPFGAVLADGGAAENPVPDPRFGCGATIAPNAVPGRSWMLLLSSLGLATVLRQRTRRQRTVKR